jgi:hypothetical protein
MRDFVDPAASMPSYHLFTQPTDPAVLAERSRAWNGDKFSFHDVLDTLNPLQHIPVISTIYRYLTGDTIGAIPRIAGDTLYGGPLGFLSGLVGASLKQDSGKDVGETAVALLTGDDGAGTSPGGTAVAASGQPATVSQIIPNQSASSQTAAGAPAGQAAGANLATNRSVAGPVAASATAAAVPISAAVIGGPSSLKSLAATTGPGAPATAQPAATAGGDPRAAFLARAEAMRREYSGSGGVTPSNKVVPLQGVALPPKFSSQPQPLKLSAPGQPGAPSTDGGSSTTTTAANAQSGDALPSNPPIDVSQHMLDALDKYMRLQQQRDSGGQVDVVH